MAINAGSMRAYREAVRYVAPRGVSEIVLADGVVDLRSGLAGCVLGVDISDQNFEELLQLDVRLGQCDRGRDKHKGDCKKDSHTVCQQGPSSKWLPCRCPEDFNS